MKRRLLLLALPLALAACGTASPSSDKSVKASAVAEIQAGDKFNDTDVMFLQMLEIKALDTVSSKSFDMAFLNLFLAHQYNAIEMAHLETTNGSNQAVKAFAARVRESRQGEVQQMLKLMNS